MESHTSARLTGVAPILLVKDAASSICYYEAKLGFQAIHVVGDPPQFAIMARDGMRVFLQQATDARHIVPHWTVSPNIWNIYFWTDDPDALFEELKQRGATIDYGLCIQPYGCREFGVRDLDDYDIGFGKVISP